MKKNAPEKLNWKILLQSIVDNRKGGTRYAFLLGAGASIKSKIPGAAVLANDWLEEIKENNPAGFQELLTDPEYDEKDVTPLYSELYRVRFPIAKDGHRFIEDIMTREKVWPSIGYSVLAQVMNEKRHNLVLTTNFDRLTETALLYYQNVHARVIAHETMLEVTAIDDQYPSIAKVHHDMFFSPKSREEELDALGGKWFDFVKEILKRYELIVIGYGGNDKGLMKILREALEENNKAKIYWCYFGKKVDKLPDFKQQVMPVEIPSFDKMMLVLGEKLSYPRLSESFVKDAVKRKKAYDAEIDELVSEASPGEDSEVAEAISKLVASSWWEVELKVKKTQDPEEKQKLYLAGIKKFPESNELHCNYAIFLKNVKRNYNEAERHYKKALELNPNDGHINSFYAIFLFRIRKKGDGAELHFKKAIEAEPDDIYINGNYANFLKDIKKDYESAEKYYRKALEAKPNHSNSNGNFAGSLLALGRRGEAIPFLERAEKNADRKDLQLELHFYRLAHFPEMADDSRKAIKKLLKEGVRSPGWDFSQNIEQAEKDGCNYVEELKELADKISEVK